MNAPSTDGRVLGRYALFDEIASGGMATVHLGRLVGPVGFSRTVAIKRLYPQFAKDEEFASMFLDEARLAGRIHHPNVVTTLDIVSMPDELFLVMQYVDGETLSALMRLLARREQTMPVGIAASIVAGALYGLHAAHEAKSEQGEPLDIVHRDVSPQNIMVGRDGVPRVLDFGVAKAASRIQSTRGGKLKGKLPYMSPEQIQGHSDRRTDVYAASVVLWEALAGRRLFDGDNDANVLMSIMQGNPPPPSRFAPSVPHKLDAIVARGLAVAPAARFATAHEMAVELETAVRPATAREIGEWMSALAGERLAKRAARVAEIESSSGVLVLGDSDIVSAVSASAEPAGWNRTGMTASSPTVAPAASSSRRRWIPLALGGALGACLLALGWLLLAPRSPSRASAIAPSAAAPPPSALATATTTGAPPEAVAVTAPAPSAAGAAPTPVASAPAPVESIAAPAPVEPIAAPAVPKSAPTTSLQPTKATAAKPTPAPRAKPSCDPPYTIDGNGIKHYKPECL